MNTVTITGRFCADPEMKITPTAGKAVTTAVSYTHLTLPTIYSV